MAERKLTPQERYDKKNCKQVHMKLHLRYDKDVLDWLDAQPTTQGAIKRLIREEIAREKDECAK